MSKRHRTRSAQLVSLYAQSFIGNICAGPLCGCMRGGQGFSRLSHLDNVLGAFLALRDIRNVHPAYRTLTTFDDAQLLLSQAAIAQMVQEKSHTDVWHPHALVGQSDRYHVTPDAGDVTYIVWLHDGLCVIVQVLPPFASCSLTEHTLSSVPL